MSAAIQSRRRDVIAGTYSEFRHVKTRSVLQIIVEVPMERAKEALDLLGVPQTGSESWVALAPLAFNPYIRTEDGSRELPLGDEEGTKAVQNAVLRCKEPGFQNWLMAKHGRPPQGGWPEDTVIEELRKRLGIESRREIGTDRRAREAWKALIGSYYEDTRYGPSR